MLLSFVAFARALLLVLIVDVIVCRLPFKIGAGRKSTPNFQFHAIPSLQLNATWKYMI
jgi:hypothetical protein